MTTPRELQRRTESFAADVVTLCRGLPPTPEGRNIRDQLGRAATSVAANYRATCRARSRAEFVAKLGLVIEEADESHMWLGMLIRLQLASGPEVDRLLSEADQLVAIFVASRRTASRVRR
jgi:four helix bundle protein